MPLGLNELRQLGGRGARDGAGEVVVYVAAWQPTPDLVAPDEAILSALGDARHLAAQLVVEVASHLATTPEQLARVFARSLSATQRRLPDVRQAIDTMLAAQFIHSTAVVDEKIGGTVAQITNFIKKQLKDKLIALMRQKYSI